MQNEYFDYHVDNAATVAVAEFWKEKYLDEYIHAGGSKIKFVTGGCGSGKTRFLESFLALAQKGGYITSSFSAKQVWLHDFKYIYTETLTQADIIQTLTKCSHKIISELGYQVQEIPEGLTLVDYLSASDSIDALTKREIRLLLNKMFLQNPLVDNNFALACSLITGGILGHPLLEEPNKEL